MTFTINSSSFEVVYGHLANCNSNFKPLLSERGDIKEYAAKISNAAVRFEAWDGDVMIGLVAAYLNNFEQRIGFITNVSVETAYLGKGVARQLVQNCIDYAKANDFRFINLEVFDQNVPAINLYKKLSFEEIKKNDQFVTMQLAITE